MPEWDEDEELFGDEEETDLGEDTPTPVVQSESKPSVHLDKNKFSHIQKLPKPKNGRRVKVKPMPHSISEKWPDVVSMLLTTQTGKQVLFVKG